MKKFLIVASLAFAMMSCGGNKATTEEQNAAQDDIQEATDLTLNGKWRLNDYAGEAEIAQMDSTQNYYLQFNANDSTFGMQTDCNSLGGEYKVSGDSITFDNIAVTQMACPDQTVESAMLGLLPRIDTYVILPDSTLQLRSDARIMAQFKYVAE